jgi:hypothetical protein
MDSETISLARRITAP